MTHSGPQTQFSESLHAQKYRGPGETFREYANRVAGVLAPGQSFHIFRDILQDQRFLPGGRIQTAIGSTRETTPYNCYVSGTIEDSLTDGDGSIMARASQAARTMQMGGGIGYGFSTLRPRGANIRKLGSRSSGPISFMGIYDAICRTIASAGHRRGAQMGVMRIDHPDIEEFIRAKHDSVSLTGFNLSIAVTDEFMCAVQADGDFALRWGGEVYRTVKARTLWEMVMRSTWDWAEPGVLFIDRINDMNPLSYCEKIEATNPCGEQPLPPFGACLLGSFNLVKYLVRACGEPGTKLAWAFDYSRFADEIHHVVPAMDRVVDVAKYPLYEQEKEARTKRRMGLGVTGLANTIEAMGFPYGSDEFLEEEARILETLRNEAYASSALLASARGSFPAFDKAKYLASAFAQTLPDYVRDAIEKHGLRNSHLTSIAPTGTISLTADNVSSGIEPVFSYEADRTIIEFDGAVKYHVEDYGAKFLGVRGKTADKVTAQEHVRVLCTAQKYVDSSVSKTCNVPPDMAWDDFKQLYMDAWLLGAKGCTTFNAGGKRMGILVAKNEDPEPVACRLDPETGRGTCE
jgi:ribonucleoside-diphosphate reductase alpha chain